MNSIVAIICQFKEDCLPTKYVCLKGQNKVTVSDAKLRIENKYVTVLITVPKSQTKIQLIFAVLILFIPLYLKRNVKATYLPIEANTKEIKETKSVIGTIKTKKIKQG